MLDGVAAAGHRRLSCLGAEAVLHGLEEHAKPATGVAAVGGLAEQDAADLVVARPVGAGRY